jgi:tetratricopeptide (TPR) repeat protein
VGAERGAEQDVNGTGTRVELARAQQLYELGRPAEALEAVGLVLAAVPDEPAALRLAALCQSALGRQQEAAATGRAAVAADPDSEHARRILAHIHYKTGEYRAAAEITREAIRLAPHEWRGFMLMARCLCHLDPRAAVAPAERSRELAPTSPEAHFTCALVYQALERRDEARAEYLRVLELNPQHAMAHNNLAVLERSARHGNRALAGFRRALSSDPQQSLARRNIEAILLTRLWRLALTAVVGVEVVDAFGPALGCTALRVLGIVIEAALAGAVWFSLWPARRAVGPLARNVFRNDRRALLREAIIAAAMLFVLVAAILQPFRVTNDYTTVNIGVAVVLGVIAGRTRKRATPSGADGGTPSGLPNQRATTRPR